MKLIVTVGMPGSGKDELIAVAQSMGLATLKMGDLVRDETRRRGLALNNANVGRIASEERDKHGPGVWAQRALPKLTETRMLVDGCRSDGEVSVFRHNFGDLFVLGISRRPRRATTGSPRGGGATTSTSRISTTATGANSSGGSATPSPSPTGCWSTRERSTSSVGTPARRSNRC